MSKRKEIIAGFDQLNRTIKAEKTRNNVSDRKILFRQFSWFQWLIIGYLEFASITGVLLMKLSLTHLVIWTIMLVLSMWGYNVFIHPIVRTDNKKLKKIWKIFQYVVIGFIVLWFILFIPWILGVWGPVTPPQFA